MNNLIVCPHCGAQYLPIEIFTPDAVFGKEYIEDTKKRSYTNGRFPDGYRPILCTKESYICDFCEKTFYIDASLTFSVSANKNTQKASMKSVVRVNMPKQNELEEDIF